METVKLPKCSTNDRFPIVIGHSNVANPFGLFSRRGEQGNIVARKEVDLHRTLANFPESFRFIPATVLSMQDKSIINRMNRSAIQRKKMRERIAEIIKIQSSLIVSVSCNDRSSIFSTSALAPYLRGSSVSSRPSLRRWNGFNLATHFAVRQCGPFRLPFLLSPLLWVYAMHKRRAVNLPPPSARVNDRRRGERKEREPQGRRSWSFQTWRDKITQPERWEQREGKGRKKQSRRFCSWNFSCFLILMRLSATSSIGNLAETRRQTGRRTFWSLKNREISRKASVRIVRHCWNNTRGKSSVQKEIPRREFFILFILASPWLNLTKRRNE